MDWRFPPATTLPFVYQFNAARFLDEPGLSLAFSFLRPFSATCLATFFPSRAGLFIIDLFCFCVTPPLKQPYQNQGNYSRCKNQQADHQSCPVFGHPL